MKKVIPFDLDGTPVYIEVEDTKENSPGMQRVSRGGDKDDKTENRFTDAIAKVKPAAETVLKAFREMDTPDEIGLEDDPVKVSAQAKKKGIDDPVVFYIPKKDVVQIYQCL